MDIKNRIEKNWYTYCIIGVILLAFVLRFYNYQNRWGLAYDQAHDALVARYALHAHTLPLLGPFSSAGAFQTGGEWYWFIMLGTIPFPFSVLTPWVVLTIAYVFFVYLIIRFGEELVDKKFGLITGFFAAVSTAQISQSANLTNQSPLAILALLATWFAIKYVRTKKEKYIFLSSFFVSLAASVHLQGVVLISLIFFTVVFSGIPTIRGIKLIFLGLFLPWLPVMLVDITNNFYNTRNMMQYYFVDQYKISLDVLGRRWLTYLGVFWPNAWAHIIGGHIFMGYSVIILIALTTVFKFFKRVITREWYIIICSFLGMITFIRYTRTTIFDSYLVFLHTFIFLLTTWMVVTFFNRKVAFIGLLMAFVLGGTSIIKDIPEITNAENYTAVQSNLWVNEITKKFPKEKFAVYDLTFKHRDKSLPLALFLESQRRIDDNGVKLGLFVATSGAKIQHPVVFGKRGGYQILNLSSSTSAELQKAGWAFVNPSAIYQSTEEWYKRK